MGAGFFSDAWSGIKKGFVGAAKAVGALTSGDLQGASDAITATFTDEQREQYIAARKAYVDEMRDYWQSMIPTMNRSILQLQDQAAEQARQIQQIYDDLDAEFIQLYDENDPSTLEERKDLEVRMSKVLTLKKSLYQKPFMLGNMYFENGLESIGRYREYGPGGKQAWVPMFIDGVELPRLIGDRRWAEISKGLFDKRDFDLMSFWKYEP